MYNDKNLLSQVALNLPSRVTWWRKEVWMYLARGLTFSVSIEVLTCGITLSLFHCLKFMKQNHK